MKEAVIFDMDGVLVDTVALNWQAINQTLAPYGIHVEDEELHRYVGRSLKDQIAQLSVDYGVELNYEEIEAESSAIKVELMSNLTPKAGVLELLYSLKNQGTPLAVATSNTREVTENRLKSAGIIEFFDIFVTEDDVTLHKPEPEVFLKAAEALGISVSNCVVFEDAPSGVIAAKAAGMKCIAVETPYVKNEDLAIADYIVDSLVSVDERVVHEVLTRHHNPEKLL